MRHLFLIGILLISLLAHYPSLQSDVTCWAGGRDISNLSTVPWLSLCLHLLNVVGVYIFIFLLTRQFLSALVVSLIFGIHPMYVDVVAWSMRQGDLLFSLAYLFSLVLYVMYLRDILGKHLYIRWIYYGFSVVFFCVATYVQYLSFTMPLALLLLDYAEGRAWRTRKALLDKLPFFLISLVGIYLSFIGNTQAVDLANNLSFWKKIYLSAYALFAYFIKFFIPTGQGLIHPYSGFVSEKSVFFIGCFVLCAAIYLVVRLIRRGMFTFFNKQITFGLLFFLLHILPVLFVPLDSYLIWIAYKTYLPYIGLAYLVMIIYYQLSFKNRDWVALAFLGLLTIGFSYLTWQRTTYWQNSLHVFSNVIAEYPNDELAYYLRGSVQLKRKNYKEALTDLSIANQLRPAAITYFLLGHTYTKLKDYNNAILNYEKIANVPVIANSFSYCIDMATDYVHVYNHAKAREFLKKAETLAIDSASKGEYFMTYGIVHTVYLDYAKATESYEKALLFAPNLMEPYVNLGTINLYKGRVDEAIRYLKKAETLAPNDKIILGNLANCYLTKKDTVSASYYNQKYQQIVAKEGK